MDSTSVDNPFESTIFDDDISSIDGSEHDSLSTIEYETDDDTESDTDGVLEFLDEIHEARENLRLAQLRVNQILGVDSTGDAVMPDAPPPPHVFPETIDMDGVEQSPPQPDAVSINGFLQVLGPDGLFHQTRYVFTATTAQVAQIFGMFVPHP